MGEVLSQSQIDALLQSLAGGGEDANGSEPEPAAKFRKYDFSTPKKFTKDRLRILHSIYENYGRIISSHLASILRMPCEIELINVEEQRYYEFANALSEDTPLVFSDIVIPEQDVSQTKEQEAETEEEDPIMLVLSQSVLYCMINRMLGGMGNLNQADQDGGYTDIELAIYQIILEHIIPLMKDAWQNYLDFKTSFQRIETSPKLVQAISVDDVVVIVMFNIKVNNINGQLTVCIPGTTLEFLFQRIEQSLSGSNRHRDNQTQREKDSLLFGIESATLELKAVFKQACVSLRDVYDMRIGDVIHFHIPKDSDIYLAIEDKPWFTGQMGIYKENKAVMITGTVEDDDEEDGGGMQHE